MKTEPQKTAVPAPEAHSIDRLAGLRARVPTSRAAAVKLFCIECVGGVRADVRDCTATTCALYLHRPYRVKP